MYVCMCVCVCVCEQNGIGRQGRVNSYSIRKLKVADQRKASDLCSRRLFDCVSVCVHRSLTLSAHAASDGALLQTPAVHIVLENGGRLSTKKVSTKCIL